jgi:DNA end-binding protein Ku
MRSIWKGSISFGLVSIPIKLYAATEEKDVSFHQVHAEDGGRIKYKRVCTVDGEEVPYADISKGYERADGSTVILTDEDFSSLPIPTAHVVDVITFVPAEDIDPTALAKAYYAEPSGDAKPYVLLRDTLAKTGRVAVVKIALRQRERLATLRVQGDVMVLQTMLWPDEVRTPDLKGIDADVKVRPQEIAMATSYVDALSGTFDASDYHDDYRAALKTLADAKADGRLLEPLPAASEDGRVVDLMQALRASVEAAKAERSSPKKKAATPRKAAASRKKAPSAAPSSRRKSA